jgi:hypothetical protein
MTSDYMPEKVEYWRMSMQDLARITKYVYGIEYDVQMGERSQGSYVIASTDDEVETQGYWKGMGQGYGYDQKYIEGAKWVQFVEDGAGAEEAIEKWINQERDPEEWKYGQPRPFDKVGKNGEYTLYQPDLEVVLSDLAKRGKLPEGTYFIDIDW